MRDVVNIQAVQVIANALHDLREEFVFVGGSIISLYADDPAADLPRPTTDIDLVIQIASYSEYEKLEERLRQLQFHHSPEDAILCRYRYDGVIVDIMPTDVPSIGPTNKWYVPGMEHAVSHALGDRTSIKILTVPYFLATKFEAFKSRGRDMRTSKDFEDIVYLLDSRLELVHEVMTSPNDIRVYLRELKRPGRRRSIWSGTGSMCSGARLTFSGVPHLSTIV